MITAIGQPRQSRHQLILSGSKKASQLLSLFRQIATQEGIRPAAAVSDRFASRACVTSCSQFTCSQSYSIGFTT